MVLQEVDEFRWEHWAGTCFQGNQRDLSDLPPVVPGEETSRTLYSRTMGS